jgi:hypothetical protein
MMTRVRANLIEACSRPIDEETLRHG